MAISFGGLGNGVDFGQIVDFLVQVERAPIDRLNKKKDDAQTKLTDFGSLGTKLLALQGSASSLKSRIAFDKSQVDVTSGSAQTLLTATASSTATNGTFSITVNQLASANQIASKASTAVASTSTDIVSGSSAAFTFQVGGGAAQTVNLSATDTLDDLVNAINNLGAGVSATTLNTGSTSSPQFRLVLTSNTPGASNAVTISTDTTTLDTVTTGTDTFQAAQDSQIVLGSGANAVTLNRSSNTITDVISGLTLNLQAVDVNNPVTVTVSRDTAAVKDAITSFVTSFNDVVNFIGDRTTFDVETGDRGIFVGETLPRSILDRLRRNLSEQISGATTLTGVGQIGFTTDANNGTISIDDAALDKQLNENFDSVRDLFIQNTTTGTVGVAQKLVDAVDEIDAVDTGSLTIRQKTLTDQIDAFTSQITKKEADLVKFEEQQKIKFAKLDGLLSTLQSQLNLLQRF